MEKAEGTGKKQTYQASFEEIWAELPKAVEGAGLKVVSTNRAERSVLAEHGMSAFSYGGEVAVLFVHPVDARHSTVKVVSKGKVKTNVTAHHWEKPIFEQLGRRFRNRSLGAY